jgi:hypothetical protein
MGYMIVMGPCLVCRHTFSYNPDHVPSLRVEGRREPICRDCMDEANRIRVKQGNPPHRIHPEAYEPLSDGAD